MGVGSIRDPPLFIHRRCLGQQEGKGPALGPPALFSAEMTAPWGSVLHLNQTGDLLSHTGQFQDAEVVSLDTFLLTEQRLWFLGHMFQNELLMV